jgi:hypothetical protein
MKRAAGAVVFVALTFWVAPSGEAHKGITSKFTYNADAHAVFVNRCGRCHVEGGVGPMSLLKYEDAFPWAESLRAELLTAYLDSPTEAGSPKVDPHDFVKAAHRQISARELDILLDWATGGTPEGEKTELPPPPVFSNAWAGAEPSLIVRMVSPYRMPADTFEATQEFSIPVSLATEKNATEMDVLPGNPSIVRSAAISLRSPDGTRRMLGTWFPRQIPAPISLKPAVSIAPGSQIIVSIHYKKTWKFEGEAMTDESTIGLYLAD